jgi:ATP-dependent Lhr-like helicase
LQPRVSWDRVRNRLLALPGSRNMVLMNGGTIPDTGQYAAYTGTGLRIGELDEEFIYERRIGDVFRLGTNSWRLESIETDRVIVSPVEGAPALIPFWRGEGGGRTYDLGVAIGEFLREMVERIKDEPPVLPPSLPAANGDEKDGITGWLQREYHLDANAARSLRHHVVRQFLVAGCVPTDRTLAIEASRDQLGDWQVILLSPLGHRLHLTLRFALEAMLQQRLGYRPQILHHSDGILIRLTDTDEPITDLFTGLTAENAEGLVLDELADSALFALRFRQNAARSLLLPRGRAGGRAPLWLQRLRGRDLLQVARRHPDFPIVVETFRECLHDHLDLPRLQELIAAIHAGRVEVHERRAEAPSPFASGLLFAFTASQMYNYDDVEPEGAGAKRLDRHLLEQLVSPQMQEHLLDPRAVHLVEKRLRGLGRPPRSATEMAEWLRRLGDMTDAELEGPMAAFLAELEADGRALRIALPRVAVPQRWISVEERGLYEAAFGLESGGRGSCRAAEVGGSAGVSPSHAADETQAAATTILERFLTTHALVGLADVLARYPFEPEWAERQLVEWSKSGRVVVVQRSDAEPMQWSAPDNLEQVQRGSLALLRREVATCPPQQFADFVLRWQYAHPSARRGAADGLGEVLMRLEGLALPASLWEQTVLPARVSGYQPRWLDEWTAGGHGVWIGRDDAVAFLARDTLSHLALPPQPEAPLDEPAGRVLDSLRNRGASFLTDIAPDTGLSPGGVRAALAVLVKRGLVTNDRFDVVRRAQNGIDDTNPTRQRGTLAHSPRLRVGLVRRSPMTPEGRWSAISWGRPELEALAVYQASLLLNRYGVVSRELALLDPWLPPWRVLYEVLSRMELAGDVRRGYFAEGLSGAQFALPEAATMLQDLALPSTATAPAVLLNSQDPANLYGSGAPFDVPLLDGGTRPLLRRAGNWLIVRAGRPVLLVEQQGRKLTALASASREDLTAATACLPGICGTMTATRHKLTVDEWNGQPVTTSPGRELLEAVGFVNDYTGMTLYAAWK